MVHDALTNTKIEIPESFTHGVMSTVVFISNGGSKWAGYDKPLIKDLKNGFYIVDKDYMNRLFELEKELEQLKNK